MANFRKIRFFGAIAASVLSAFVFFATLIEPHWIELVFDEAPDDGDGSLETWIALGCSLVVAAACARLAQVEWRRLSSAPAQP